MDENPLDLAPLQEVLEQYKTQPGAVIPVLQKAQEIYGWLPEEVLQAVAEGMDVPLSRIYGVVTLSTSCATSRWATLSTSEESG
jgi:NADH:ubiquinone oxidoreductase subunit E